MRILTERENKKFYIHNKHLFYYDHECMEYLGDEIKDYYIQSPIVKKYETGVLTVKYYGYEKVSSISFYTNDGKTLFSIGTKNQPFDVNLYKSKADNINSIVFDSGVLVSIRNIDNQSKYIFYFYDKTFITGYDFDAVINKVKMLSKPKEYTDMILNQLENPSQNQSLDL